MKRLTILRHAKSSWEDSGRADHDRPLNARGWKAARRLGRKLSDRGMQFDHVLASPASRVRETLDGLSENFAVDAPIAFEPQMYLADEETLLTLVRGLPESAEAPLLVGHNPGLERLILELTHGDRNGLRDRVAHRYPTCGLAVVDLRAERWSEVERGTSEVAELIFPRELD